MILRELVALAEREGLVKDAAFEEKRVDFEVRIDAQGRYRGLVSLRNEDGKGVPMLVPRFPKRSVGVSSGFLVDNAKYVLGIGDPKKDKPARVSACQAAFAARIHDVLQRAKDPALVAAAAFCANLDAARRVLLCERAASEWTGGEIVVLAVDQLGYVHERAQVRAAWSLMSSGDGEPTSEKGNRKRTQAGRCLVTGKMAPAERLHPAVKRVPGGQSSGTSLVSFNAAAFASHGMEQGANAPVSRAAAIAYTTALNHLLSRDEERDRPYRQGVRLGNECIALYWTTAPTQSLDFFADLLNGPRPDEAEAFLLAPRRGDAGRELDGESFYILTIGGNAARLVVRDWFESTLGRVRESIHRYFDDLAIGNKARPFAIWELLAAIDPPGNASVPPDLGARLFASAIKGIPLPREILRHALARFRRPAEGRNVEAARAGLIKGALRGIGRTEQSRHHLKEVTVSLEEDNPQPPYQMGRLFAVLERAQQNALGGDLNATIRDRYFAAASTAPATVFPRLLRLTQHHIAKARSEGREYGVEKLIGQIVDRLPAAAFPSLLSLEDQGLFAVGYYHQKESFFASRKA